jgi:hypothetical protein
VVPNAPSTALSDEVDQQGAETGENAAHQAQPAAHEQWID